MAHLEKASGAGQLLQPRFAAVRTMVLDYFRSTARLTPPERTVFRWDESMGFGPAERNLTTQLALELGFPRDDHSLRAYLSGENGALMDLLPELGTLRDVAFSVATSMVPSLDALPDINLSCKVGRMSEAVTTFLDVLLCGGSTEDDAFSRCCDCEGGPPRCG